MNFVLICAALCGLYRVSQESYDGLDRTSYVVDASSLTEAATKAEKHGGLHVVKIEELVNEFRIYVDGKVYGGWENVAVVPPVVGMAVDYERQIVLGKNALVCKGEAMLSSHLKQILSSELHPKEIAIRMVAR